MPLYEKVPIANSVTNIKELLTHNVPFVGIVDLFEKRLSSSFFSQLQGKNSWNTEKFSFIYVRSRYFIKPFETVVLESSFYKLKYEDNPSQRYCHTFELVRRFVSER